MKGKHNERDCDNKVWLSVVGIGEEGYDAITADAQMLCEQARHIIGTPRHIASLPRELQARAQAWLSPFAKNLEHLDALRDSLEDPSKHPSVCVLATGDPFSYGVGSVLLRRYGLAAMRVVPWRGSFSLAAAAMGWAHDSCTNLTLHGRPFALLRRYLTPCARLLVMLAGTRDVARIAQLLCQEGLGEAEVTILSKLGAADEGKVSFKARDFKGRVALARSPLALAALELPPSTDVVRAVKGKATEFLAANVFGKKALSKKVFGKKVFGQKLALPDDAFYHDGQITKREVRALTIAALVIERDALLWDVGAGAGSVAIEWCLGGGRACALEHNARRVALIKKNRELFGLPDRLQVVHAEAQDFVKDFRKNFMLGQKQTQIGGAIKNGMDSSAPQAIFLGGCLQTPLLEQLRSLLASEGRLVANAVTLAGEATLLAFYEKHGGSLTRIAVERLEPLGSCQAFSPQRRILQYVYNAT